MKELIGIINEFTDELDEQESSWSSRVVGTALACLCYA